MKKLMTYLILLCFVYHAQAITIIELNWTEANQMAEHLSSFLRPEEKLNGINNKLIIDASPARTAELIQTARQLDQRPQSLRVEVEKTGSRKSWSDNIHVGVGIGIGSLHTRGGVGLSTGMGRGSGSEWSVQTLTILSGRNGYIEAGQSRSLPWKLVSSDGSIVKGSEYVKAVSGFYIRPRVQGNRVLIDIAVSDDAFDHRQNINTRQMETTVEGAFGEWINVGGIAKEENGSEVMLLGHIRGQTNLKMQYRVRIVGN